MTIQELSDKLIAIAPLELQESYDNSGLLVGNPKQTIRGVLVSLDVTEAVIAEAKERNCNVVVAHHPVIFSGLKRLTGANYVQRTVQMAIKNDVAIYAIHTNLDNVLSQGVNGRIAQRLGLTQVSVLSPRGEDANIGAGAVGFLPEPLSEAALLQVLCKRMNTSCVRHTPLLGKPVQKVAICGGSGSFLLPQAIATGADVFVTGDYKYHQFFDADGRILIADIGHYESEQFTIDLLTEIISDKNRIFAVLKTGVLTNPVRYYCA